MSKCKKRGISLIVLVITIIVIIILAGAVILSLSTNNPISQASKAVYIGDVKNFQTELELYESKQFLDKMGNYDPNLLQGDNTSVTYDGALVSSQTINDLIPSLSSSPKYNGEFQIIDGKLIYGGSDTIKQNWSTEIGIVVDVTPPTNPTMAANPSTWTNGDVTVTINYSIDSATKEYSTDGTTWSNYIVPIVVSTNSTVYARGKDLATNVTGVSTINVANIDKTVPVITASNGGSTTSSVTVTAVASDAGGSGLVASSYQYSKDNGTTWTAVTSATSYTFSTLTSGTYQCKVKVADNATNSTTSNAVAIATTGIGTITLAASPTGWTNGNVTVTINYPTEVVTKQYSIDGTTWNTYTAPVVVTTNATTVYAKGLDAGGNQTVQSTLTVSNIDKTVPVITASNGGSTTSSVTVTAVASDTGGSGLVTSSYQYSRDNGTTWTAVTTLTSYTFSTLTSGTYQCKVKVADNATNSTTSNAVAIATTSVGTITLAASPTGWTNGNVTVTVTYPTEVVTKQYSTNGTTWNTYTTPVVVTTNSTVYAKGLDAGGNQTTQATLTVSNIDKTSPTVAFGTNGGSGTTVSTTATVDDVGGSNINTGTLQYVWDTQNVATPGSGWVTFTNGATQSMGSVNGTYYLWIKGSDNAGNNVVSKTNAFTLTQPMVSNAPLLSVGMTAKKWNGSSWVTVSSPNTDTSWYNYETKQWANAQTADGSMWVWIPRYEYRIPTPHSSTAQTIAVNFLINTPTTPTSGYTIHPAFTFGSTQLTGIWVAKFEASGSISAIDVKPGIASLRSITIDSMFTACRNMETTYGARYGWGTSGTGIDTHLMKNTEWGAVAYLSSSAYGKTGEVWINPNYNYITGQAGTSASASATISTYAYDNATYGVNASTTGNIYGIYDMSGGTYEYTASYVNNGNGSLTTYGLSLVSAIAQYKDLYTSSGDTSSGNYSAASGKKGDAVYETSTADIGTTSWYSDNSYMPLSSIPFFARGGGYGDSTHAGVFYFDHFRGDAGSYIGFRPVIAVSGSL